MAKAAELETTVRVKSAISSSTVKTASKCKMVDNAQARIAVGVILVQTVVLETAVM